MKPNKKAIQKVLSESSLNPKEPGPLKVIADQGDPEYYQRRACELVSNNLNGKPKAAEWHQNLTLAIALLALARVHHMPEPVKAPRPKKEDPVPESGHN